MSEAVSAAMRDLLVLHIDQTRVAIVRNRCVSNPLERARLARQTKSQQAALKRGWIERTFDRNFTVLTDTGRYVLAAALSDWIEAFSRVDYQLDLGRFGRSLAPEAGQPEKPAETGTFA